MPIGVGIGLAVSVAGIGVQAYGQYKAGQSQKKVGEAAAEASESQAELADYNAGVADLQAQDTIERGDLEANQFRQQVRGAIGTQRTVQAASGVDVGYGSAVDVQADAAYLGKLDEVTIRTNAARQAWGYTVSSMNYRRQAEILRETGEAQIEAGNAAATAGKIAAVGSIASGAGSLLLTKYGFEKRG